MLVEWKIIVPYMDLAKVKDDLVCKYLREEWKMEVEELEEADSTQ